MPFVVDPNKKKGDTDVSNGYDKLKQAVADIQAAVAAEVQRVQAALQQLQQAGTGGAATGLTPEDAAALANQLENTVAALNGVVQSATTGGTPPAPSGGAPTTT